VGLARLAGTVSLEQRTGAVAPGAAAQLAVLFALYHSIEAKAVNPKIPSKKVATVISARCLLGCLKENHTAATGTVCNAKVFTFPAVKKRAVQASFTGGNVSSDGGIALLRQTDRRIGLTKALAQVLPDPREPAGSSIRCWR